MKPEIRIVKYPSSNNTGMYFRVEVLWCNEDDTYEKFGIQDLKDAEKFAVMLSERTSFPIRYYVEEIITTRKLRAL